jgi:glutamate racemase
LNERPIGIFDSGVGGLTVVKSLLRRLPNESFIYFGDTAHVPYGSKTREELFKYAEDIIGFLLNHDVKTIVVACGTHSSVTLPEMEKTCPVPILGVVKPGARAAAQASINGRIGVIATQATVNSGSYSRNIHSLAASHEVYAAACARFVPLIESGRLDDEETRQAVQEYIQPLLEQGIDTLVLGCTHYPFLREVIADYAGEFVSLVDPAMETIEELADLMEQKDILCSNPYNISREFYVSGHDQSFYTVGRLLLGDVIEKVHQVKLD